MYTKGLVGGTLPLFKFIFTLIEQSYKIYTYYSPSTTLVILIASARYRGPPLRGAESRFELGLAVQQADALQSEPHRTLKPLRTLIICNMYIV